MKKKMASARAEAPPFDLAANARELKFRLALTTGRHLNSSTRQTTIKDRHIQLDCDTTRRQICVRGCDAAQAIVAEKLEPRLLFRLCRALFIIAHRDLRLRNAHFGPIVFGLRDRAFDRGKRFDFKAQRISQSHTAPQRQPRDALKLQTRFFRVGLCACQPDLLLGHASFCAKERAQVSGCTRYAQISVQVISAMQRVA